MDDNFATGYLAGQDSNNNGNNNGNGLFGNSSIWIVVILAIILLGWGGNYGRNSGGGDSGMSSFIPYLVGTGASGQGGADTRAALSEGFYQQDTSRSLAGIQNGICSLGYDQLAQMNGINANIASGFAGVNNAICTLGYQNAQLVNGLERSVANGDNATQLAIMQEGNARQAGQTALATQLASCCCENKQLIGDLKYTIAQEDCATRQAIADNARAVMDNCNANYRSLMDYFVQDKIATLTAENQNLKFAASQASQNALLTNAMCQQTDTILNRVNPRPIPAYQVANPNIGVNCCNTCC